MNRIEPIKEKLEAENDQEDQMILIMDALKDTVEPIPEVGKFYTFIYNAKTYGISYDQHPLIACTEILPWGFRGINYHLRKPRQYTWNEIAGQLYQVYDDELNDLDAIPFAHFRTK